MSLYLKMILVDYRMNTNDIWRNCKFLKFRVLREIDFFSISLGNVKFYDKFQWDFVQKWV